MTHFINIRLLPDRSEGGGSIGNGKIELMMHRRITEDDGRGVNEPLDELGKLAYCHNNIRLGWLWP
jgi:hypothetical protein